MYLVTVQLDNKTIVTDTLVFTIEKNSLITFYSGIWKINWTSNVEMRKEVRGLNITKEMIELQMPILCDYLENENISIAPYPKYSSTVKVGYYFEMSHDFLKGYGKLEGIKINQKMVVEDSTLILFNGKQTECQVMTGENTSGLDEFGVYHIKTFFNIEHGFLKIEYNYPNNKKIRFELIPVIKY